MTNPLLKFFSAESALGRAKAEGPLPDNEVLLRNTLGIAWPAVVESLLLAIVGFIDTMMVSTLGDTAVAAVGLTQQPKMLSLAVFFGLSPAVAALVARRRGENDRDSAIRVLRMAICLATVLCTIITFVFFRYADAIISFAGSQDDTHELAVSYFKIIIGGMFFNVLTYTINSAQRGAGNTRITLVTNIASNGVNIIFNYLLINGKFGFPKLGVAGAAYATVLGTIVALILAVISVMKPDGYLYLAQRSVAGMYEKRSFRSLMSLFSSTMIEQVFMRIGFFVYAKIVAGLGTMPLTIHQIGMNVLNIPFAAGDGLSSAAVALVGRSLGEKRKDLAKIYGSFCQRCGVILSLIISLIFVFFGQGIYGLFSSTPEVLETGGIIMKLMCVVVWLQVSQVIFSGCLRGSGDTKYTAFVSCLSITVLRPIIAYAACYIFDFGIIGAWCGLALDQFIRFALTGIRFYGGKWAHIEI